MSTVDDLSVVLSKTQRILKDKGIDITENCKNVKHFVEKNISLCEDVVSLFTTLHGYLPQFTSGEIVPLLLSVVGVVKAVSVFTCIGTPVVPVICDLLSKIISSFGGNKITMKMVVESEIKKTFHGHSSESLMEEAVDLTLKYQMAFGFLKSTGENDDCSEHDITNINIQMEIFQGATFLRKFGKLIKELAKECKEKKQSKKIETAKNAMEFIELYANLASLRDMILLYFYAILKSTAHSQCLARGIQQVISSFDEQDRDVLGMFLKPTEEYVYIVSYVREEEHGVFMEFLEQKKLLPDQKWLTRGDFKLCSIKWPKYHVVRPENKRLCLFGDLRFLRGSDGEERPNSAFGFKQHRKHYFRITHGGESGEVLSMTKSSHQWVMSVNEEKSHQNEWKVIQMENGNYVFSPRAFPDYFMGMSKLLDGSIAGFLGGYNEQCHWKLCDHK